MFLASISLDSIANGITTWWFQHLILMDYFLLGYYALQVQNNINLVAKIEQDKKINIRILE
jgi:hypothetical protein